MKCQNCGSFIRDDSKFCNYCGQKVNIRPQRTENPGVSTRPRDEDFDVAITVQKETEEDVAEKSQRSIWVMIALVAVGALFACLCVLLFELSKSNTHIVVSEATTEEVTEQSEPTETEEETESAEETEEPTETEEETTETPAPFRVVSTEEGVFHVYEDWAAIISYRTPDPILVLPDEIDGIPITCIANSVFENNGTLMYIQLPAQLGVINSRAFANCKNLREVVMPASLNQLGADVFKDTAGFRIISKAGTFAERLAAEMELEWQEGDRLTVPVIE